MRARLNQRNLYLRWQMLKVTLSRDLLALGDMIWQENRRCVQVMLSVMSIFLGIIFIYVSAVVSPDVTLEAPGNGFLTKNGLLGIILLSYGYVVAANPAVKSPLQGAMIIFLHLLGCLSLIFIFFLDLAFHLGGASQFFNPIFLINALPGLAALFNAGHEIFSFFDSN